jgi:hypothetical protein
MTKNVANRLVTCYSLQYLLYFYLLISFLTLESLTGILSSTAA